MGAGAFASYRTKTHHKSALEWSKILKLKRIQRTLEIYALVQAQVYEIFYAISCGDDEKLNQIVGGGEFFDPLNTYLLENEVS